jgi:hypothetical protein
VDQAIWRMQKSLKNAQKTNEKNAKQPKKVQNPSKIINAPQKYSNIYRPPEIWHTKKWLKLTQNQTKIL